METLRLENITKIYKGKKKEEDVVAVKDFNLSIEDNEFIVFVGPSGCGKSTTLRMIAGLEDISGGSLFLNGEKVNDIEAQYRNIAMVFQNYALYPHMTAYQNMAFGLKNRKVPDDEIEKRIKNAAAILNIEHLLKRKPKAMSGGERQRVALGRAIVRTPKVFLLDEPLSNLDAKLRSTMRVEIARLFDKLKTTFIYVTHDQVEAMTMGSRIVVMCKGVVQQIDTPTNLFDFPKNRFVAGFLGTPQMNFYEGTLICKDDEVTFKIANQTIKYGLKELRQIDPFYLDGEQHRIILGIRPDDVTVAKEGLEVKITLKEVLGNETLIYTNFDKQYEQTVKDSPTALVIKVSERVNNVSGDLIHIQFKPNKICLFKDEPGEDSICLTPRSKRNELVLYCEFKENKFCGYFDKNNGIVFDELSPESVNEIYHKGMHRFRVCLNDAISISDKGLEATFIGKGLINNEMWSTFELTNKTIKESFYSPESHIYIKNDGTYKFGEKVHLSIDFSKLSMIGDDNKSIFDLTSKEQSLDEYGLVKTNE